MARGWFGNSAGHSAAAKGRGSGGAVRRASKSVSSATKPKAPFVSVNRSGSKTKGIKPEEILAGTRMKGKNTVVAFSGKQANSQARAMAAGGKVSGVRVNRKGVGTKRGGTKVTRTF